MVLFRRSLGDILRGRRTELGLTLREVSGAARVSLGYISEIERGQKEASSELLPRCATRWRCRCPTCSARSPTPSRWRRPRWSPPLPPRSRRVAPTWWPPPRSPRLPPVRSVGRSAGRPLSAPGAPSACSRAIRSAIGGWVANIREMSPRPERVRDHHVTGVLQLRGRRQRCARGAVLQLAQGRGERQRVAGEPGAVLVGVVLAGPADRHLDDARGERARGGRWRS